MNQKAQRAKRAEEYRKEQQEAESYTFEPKINNVSRLLADRMMEADKENRNTRQSREEWLYGQSKNLQAKLQKMRLAREDDENCTFQPSICERSRRMASRGKSKRHPFGSQ